jgi:hypothetical protein
MTNKTDIIVFGTGQFAERIVADLAATAPGPIRAVIAGRNQDRLNWLATAANARAFMFNRPATFDAVAIDAVDTPAVVELLKRTRPKLVVQTASSQPSAVIGHEDTRWSRLIARAGLSATAAAQSLLTLKVGEAIRDSDLDSALINCCFPDVVNGLLEARGIPVLCGTGNVAILSNAFSGNLPDRRQKLQVLAHYQQLVAWRQPAEKRGGVPPRVWIDGQEVQDVFARFSNLKLTVAPAIEISGASGVSLMSAFVLDLPWAGHVPGPSGRPGGYPVRLEAGRLLLDLPASITPAEAIAWNSSFETEMGLTVDMNGRASFTGLLRESLEAENFPFAEGFDVTQIEQVAAAQAKLRSRLEALPA